MHNLLDVSTTMFYATVEHYRSFAQYVPVPAIVGITGACENIDTLFRIGNRNNRPLFFTQTGQLSLEQALQYTHGVYTIVHSGRDEPVEDERHLRQFRLTEEEFDCTLAGMTRDTYDEEVMFDALLGHIEGATKAMIEAVVYQHRRILQEDYGRDCDELLEILDGIYPRLSYETAIEYLGLEFGVDLGPEDEAVIVDKFGLGYWPVFITKYPKDIKFFNMKVSSQDPRVVLSADCIFPIAGEAVGSAVREHDADKLTDRLVTSDMFRMHEARGGSLEDFRWYLDIIASGRTLPHAGYGIGNERLIQYILGLPDIRQCSAFYLYGVNHVL